MGICIPGIGRELRNETIVCWPCSLNFEVIKGSVRFICRTFYASHFLFAFCHEIWIYAFETLKEKKSVKIWHFRGKFYHENRMEKLFAKVLPFKDEVIVVITEISPYKSYPRFAPNI